MLLTLVATTWSVIVVRMCNKISTYDPLSEKMVKVVRLLGQIMLVNSVKPEQRKRKKNTEEQWENQEANFDANGIDSGTGEGVENCPSVPESKQEEWFLLIEVLDRILLLCFVVIIGGVLLHILLKI